MTGAWNDDELERLERFGCRREAVARFDVRQIHLTEFGNDAGGSR